MLLTSLHVAKYGWHLLLSHFRASQVRVPVDKSIIISSRCLSFRVSIAEICKRSIHIFTLSSSPVFIGVTYLESWSHPGTELEFEVGSVLPQGHCAPHCHTSSIYAIGHSTQERGLQMTFERIIYWKSLGKVSFKMRPVLTFQRKLLRACS